MGEDYELEEGEMNCSSDEAVVDLDVDLSYIVSFLFLIFHYELFFVLCYVYRIEKLITMLGFLLT